MEAAWERDYCFQALYKTAWRKTPSGIAPMRGEKIKTRNTGRKIKYDP